jgi:hypothetical protein
MTRWQLSFAVIATTAKTSGLLAGAVPRAVAAPGTTAWQNGAFVVDTPNLVRRTDIVWAAGGFTAQLNRTDTQAFFPVAVRATAARQFERKTIGPPGGTAPTGTVSPWSRANNQYVTAESGGAQPLIANRAALGPWETFPAGAAPLIANRNAIGPREQLDLVDN